VIESLFSTVFEVSTLGEFQQALEKRVGYMWRGVANATYALVPKVGRDWHQDLELLVYEEREMLYQFKVHAMPYLASRPENDWEWLALGQHYSLPTRLLDWTLNPLVALYFACVTEPDKDGAVYSAGRPNEVDPHKHTDPFQIDKTCGWHPLQIDQRMFLQEGLFTVSPNPLKAMTEDLRFKAVVKSSAKAPLLKTLGLFGIHYGTIFPGLEGAARYAEEHYFHLKGVKGNLGEYLFRNVPGVKVLHGAKPWPHEASTIAVD